MITLSQGHTAAGIITSSRGENMVSRPKRSAHHGEVSGFCPPAEQTRQTTSLQSRLQVHTGCDGDVNAHGVNSSQTLFCQQQSLERQLKSRWLIHEKCSRMQLQSQIIQMVFCFSASPRCSCFSGRISKPPTLFDHLKGNNKTGKKHDKWINNNNKINTIPNTGCRICEKVL